MMSLLSDGALYQTSRKRIDYCCLQTAELKKKKKKETNAMQFIMYVDINPKWSVFRRNEWKTKRECLNVKTLQFASRRPAGRSNSLPAFSSALCARLNRETKGTLLLCMNGHPPSTTHNGRKAFHAALTST